jgi:hypothetical protein
MFRSNVVIFQVASLDQRVAITPEVILMSMLKKWRIITGESQKILANVGGMHTLALFDFPNLSKNHWPISVRKLECQSYPTGHLFVRYAVDV